MKIMHMSLVMLVLFILNFESTSAHISEPEEDAKMPTYYLVSYSGFTAKTSHPELTIWTKSNPLTASDEELIQSSLIISPKLSQQKGWQAVVELHEPKSKENSSIGDILAQVDDYTYEDSNITTKRVTVMLRAKYFKMASIRLWNSEADEIILHLHEKKTTSEQNVTDPPANAPQPSPDAKENPKPE